ncbi:hypothetical protein [Streptomyces griseorubiginosus]|uniref:hypothetical protein n=1 Tax=Streptomyces griseorubiginosus TaxID=67304 RepID=UPI002E806781|nr:hypothetical protein [Streptomyces griseorubiginosus]WUB43708.1 hypothetical protein OHN19_10340 [Streptomyces griseorubiginosus]
MTASDDTPVRRCASRHSGPRDGAECGARARFEISRHARPPLVVCPQHLGPALLLADGVLWPPEIRLVR